jgi:hypothetical protein
MVGALRLIAPDAGEFWDPVRRLLPAQAAFCYRRAQEIDPRDSDAKRSLSQAFQAIFWRDRRSARDQADDGGIAARINESVTFSPRLWIITGRVWSWDEQGPLFSGGY